MTQDNMLNQATVDAAKGALERIVGNVERVIIGKRETVELVVLALVAKGHVLLEDLPGTGKTTLVSALAKSIDCKFKRIQFTPDIMPSDVSGFSIFNQKTRDFEFRPGGVMSNLVLADEINRASAKTQSALLEAMEERQVTVDSQTYPLEEPFMVLATQNPIEQFGTYPLPEAQLDRFVMKLSMGYPAFEQEVEVLELGDRNKKTLSPVVSGSDVVGLRQLAARVRCSRMVMRYIVEVVTATRDNPEVQIGSSPRGGIALAALARAYALLRGRNYVLPDDVKYLAPHVLCHRIALSHEAKVQGRTEHQVVESILSSIAVPYYDEDEVKGRKSDSAASAGDRQSAAPASTAGSIASLADGDATSARASEGQQAAERARAREEQQRREEERLREIEEQQAAERERAREEQRMREEQRAREEERRREEERAREERLRREEEQRRALAEGPEEDAPLRFSWDEENSEYVQLDPEPARAKTAEADRSVANESYANADDDYRSDYVQAEDAIEEAVDDAADEPLRVSFDASSDEPMRIQLDDSERPLSIADEARISAGEKPARKSRWRGRHSE